MEKTIYLTACGNFSDYRLLELICGFFIKNISHDNITFIAPLGGKNGDKICRLYVLKHKFKHIFLKPKEMDKKETLKKCDNAILFNNGHSKGIAISLGLLSKHITGKIVEVHQNIKELSVYSFDSEEKIITKKYSIENNNLKLA